MKTVLTIAGSDSSGGAGIQADLKTMITNGVYGMSAITAIATLITPNILEAEVLSKQKITDALTMEKAAKQIGDTYHCAVLLKGGHRVNDANDLLYHDEKFTWFEGERINNSNTHGTGCTLSSAIASNLAKGYSLEKAIAKAKHYLSEALKANLDLGKGSGPMDHAFDLKGEFKD